MQQPSRRIAMKKVLIGLAIMLALVIALPAQAGARHSHYRPDYRAHHGHHYDHGYRHPRHYGRHYDRHGHSDGFKYVGAGLILGAVANAVLRPAPVYETRVVYRRPVERAQQRAHVVPPPSEFVTGQTPPPGGHDVFLRRKANGECWLVETEANGDQVLTPQEPEVCD
jgi:hypothetical protein